MKILSNYTYTPRMKNIYNQSKVAQNSSFTSFKIISGDKDIPTKIFGSKQRADIFEKLTDEKEIDVWLFENTAGGAYGGKVSKGFEAIIVDNKPDPGQSSSKPIGTRDEKTLSQELEEKTIVKLKKEFFNMSEEEINSAILKLRKESLKKRLEESIILSHAQSQNIAIASKLGTDQNKKIYGEENILEITKKLCASATGSEASSAVAAYNNK